MVCSFPLPLRRRVCRAKRATDQEEAQGSAGGLSCQCSSPTRVSSVQAGLLSSFLALVPSRRPYPLALVLRSSPLYHRPCPCQIVDVARDHHVVQQMHVAEILFLPLPLPHATVLSKTVGLKALWSSTSPCLFLCIYWRAQTLDFKSLRSYGEAAPNCWRSPFLGLVLAASYRLPIRQIKTAHDTRW